MHPRRTGLVVALLLAGSAAAGAQVGVYGKLDLNHYNEPCSNSTAWYYGGGVGAYADLVKAGPLHAGLDLRGTLDNSSKYSYRDLLLGIRVSLHPPVIHVKPYLQGSVGVGGTKAKGPYAAGIGNVPYNNKLTAAVFGGVDLPLLPFIDLRAVELGYSRGHGASIVEVSSGLVVHFR